MVAMKSGDVFPASARNGLRQTLLGAAALTPAHTYTVLTTAPGEWLVSGSERPVSVIDVSTLFGISGWQAESDLGEASVNCQGRRSWRPSVRRQQLQQVVERRFEIRRQLTMSAGPAEDPGHHRGTI